MPASLDALFAFLLAGVLALLLVPFTDRLARRVGAIDFPNERSLHEAPTPKLGGLAILVAVLVAGLIWLPWDAETRAILIGAVPDHRRRLPRRRLRARRRRRSCSARRSR